MCLELLILLFRPKKFTVMFMTYPALVQFIFGIDIFVNSLNCVIDVEFNGIVVEVMTI